MVYDCVQGSAHEIMVEALQAYISCSQQNTINHSKSLNKAKLSNMCHMEAFLEMRIFNQTA